MNQQILSQDEVDALLQGITGESQKLEQEEAPKEGIRDYNLAQQDMVALRLTFRVGWQVANTINYQQPVEANRYPAAYVALP